MNLLISSALVVLLVSCCSVSNLMDVLGLTNSTNMTNETANMTVPILPTPALIDCGMTQQLDTACFDNAMQTCAPAEVRMAQLPIKVDITGSNGSDSCNVELTGTSLSAWTNELQTAFPSNYTAIQSELSNPAYQLVWSGFEGKTADCVIPKVNLSIMDSSNGQAIMQVCQGDLITFISSLMNASSSGTVASQSGITDCGMTQQVDTACFSNAMQTCAPAEVRLAGAPIKVDITSSAGGNDCNVEMTGISMSAWENELQTAFPSNYSALQSDFSNSEFQTLMGGFEGKTANCVVSQNNLATLDSSNSQDIMQICKGNLMTYVNSLMSMNGGGNSG